MEKLKSIKKILFDMDNDLTAAECAIVKGKFQSVQLYDDFSTEKTEFQKIHNWKSCRIMSEILLDYIVETEKKLKTVRESFNTLWKQEVKNEAKESKRVRGERVENNYDAELLKKQIQQEIEAVQSIKHLKQIRMIIRKLDGFEVKDRGTEQEHDE